MPFGITRTNAYAGLASALLLRDDYEKGLIAKGLPNYIEAGGFELPLIFQDKIFVGTDIKNNGPDLDWPGHPQHTGTLWYAHTYEVNQDGGSGRWDLGLNTADPSRSLRHPRILRRHHAGQRHGVPERHRPGAPVSPAPAERLQRPVPQPPALYRQQNP